MADDPTLTPPEAEIDEIEKEVPQDQTPPADELKNAPDNFASLADALQKEVPELTPDSKHTPTRNEKGDVTNPSQDTPPRGEDGKFQKSKTAPLAQKDDKAPEAEAEKKEPAAEANLRDSDLKVELDSHVRPKTRKVIEDAQEKARKARDERDAIKQQLDEAQKKAQEYEQSLKTIKAPKEMEEELATLRARVRELDISKDPKMEAKYDSKIKANSTAALDLLKDQGLFLKTTEKDKPPVEMNEAEKKVLVSEIEKGGIGIRGMAKYIRALEQGGEYAAAEQLRAIAQNNDRLAAEKDQEIQSWSKDYEGFQAQKTRESQAAQEARDAAVKAHGEKSLQGDLKELIKQLPFLAPPPAPAANDSADVKAAKEKAIAEYQTGSKAVEEAVKVFQPVGNPDKDAEAHGRMAASAVQAVILKQAVLPKLLKEITEYKARIAELEGEVGKTRKAATLNKAHSAAITQPSDGKRAPAQNLSIEDAMREVALESGINVNT